MQKLGRFYFGYNATVDKGRRQAPQTRVKHEEDILTKSKRRRLQATAQDQIRNHSILAWMVRKHLDYVSQFNIQIRSQNDKLDTLLKRIFQWHGRPENLDIARRFGRHEMFRMFELEKVLNGDAALIELADMKLQAMESDRITKGDYAGTEVVSDNGLVVDKYGAIDKFCICNRSSTGNSYQFDHLESYENVIFDAYWTRFGSQFRGVSPLSTALNTMQDIAEGFEWNLVKAKMHALFGVAVMRKADEDGLFGGASGVGAETEDESAADDGTHLDLDPRAVNLIDLNPGEDIKTIESGTPSTEFVEGSYLFIQTALLALDIPITCFDSRRSSFSARIADLNEYEISSKHKQRKNRYAHQAYSDWVIDTIWNDPASDWSLKSVAGAAGLSKREVQELIEWIPMGSPWIDKLKQVTGDKIAISMALDNSIDAARRRGADVFENIDKQAEVIKYANEKGVPIVTNAAQDDTGMDLILSEQEGSQ
jgi:capsid protein